MPKKRRTKITHIPKGDVPLELEGELLRLLARGLVLGANEHIVEEKEVPQLALSLLQLHDEAVLHQVALLPLLVREQLARVV